jgi:hypothetical protein
MKKKSDRSRARLSRAEGGRKEGRKGDHCTVTVVIFRLTSGFKVWHRTVIFYRPCPPALPG